MNYPFVSVVVTTWNRAHLISGCIDSILSSNYPNFEVIVINDNSSDNTDEILREYKDKILYIHNKVSYLMVKSRNLGARNAQGEHVLFVDDDNIIHENMISELVKTMDSEEKIGIVGPMMFYNSNRNLIWWSETILSYWSSRTYFPNRNSHRSVIAEKNKDTIGIPNVFMVRSSLFKKIGYFDETYIDSWTEADFGALAIKYGNRVVRVGSAETYHQVNPEDWNGLSVRSIGDNSVKAYTTIKNRYKFVGKYFSRTQKIVFLLFWSWAILCVYIICALKLGKKEYVPIYLRGVRDGLLLI